MSAEKTEVLVETINTKLNVIMYQGTRFEPTGAAKHPLWKVTLKDGLSYSLDLTGAQYGHFNPVIPWGEYTQTRCNREKTVIHGSSFKTWM